MSRGTTIYHKLVKILAYDDEIDTKTTSQKTQEAFLALEQESSGLKINQSKAKYMATRIE